MIRRLLLAIGWVRPAPKPRPYSAWLWSEHSRRLLREFHEPPRKTLLQKLEETRTSDRVTFHLINDEPTK